MICWHWFGVPDRDCLVPGWIPYMTAAELGWPEGSKLTLDHDTGEIVDEPAASGDSSAEAA